MVVVDNPAGRLVTFRVTPPVDEGNSPKAATQLHAAIEAAPGPVIVCADLTAARTFSAETSQRFVALMKSTNAKIGRSALLLGEGSATLALQVERMMREAGNPARRAFPTARALRQWVAPVLAPDEEAALRVFLGLPEQGVLRASSWPTALTGRGRVP